MARFEMTYDEAYLLLPPGCHNSGAHLVGVHVALGSTTCLEHDQGEVVEELPCNNLNRLQQRAKTLLHQRRTSSAACWIAALIFGSRPYVALTMADAFFSTPSALMSGGGNRSVGPPMSKFCRDLRRRVRQRA